MDPDYQKQLESEVDRLLKPLPNLPAPAGLAPRVLAALANRQALPWYRQPWMAWPLVLQVFALVFLLSSFGALCVACFQLTRAAGFTNAVQEVGQSLAWLGWVWNVMTVLFDTIILTIKHLGAWFIAACCFAAVLGYAICVGLGTACVRLAYARR